MLGGDLGAKPFTFQWKNWEKIRRRRSTLEAKASRHTVKVNGFKKFGRWSSKAGWKSFCFCRKEQKLCGNIWRPKHLLKGSTLFVVIESNMSLFASSLQYCQTFKNYHWTGCSFSTTFPWALAHSPDRIPLMRFQYDTIRTWFVNNWDKCADFSIQQTAKNSEENFPAKKN